MKQKRGLGVKCRVNSRLEPERKHKLFVSVKMFWAVSNKKITQTVLTTKGIYWSVELKFLEIIQFLAQIELSFDFMSLLFSWIYLSLLYHLCPQAGSTLIQLNYVTYPPMN